MHSCTELCTVFTTLSILFRTITLHHFQNVYIGLLVVIVSFADSLVGELGVWLSTLLTRHIDTLMMAFNVRRSTH